MPDVIEDGRWPILWAVLKTRVRMGASSLANCLYTRLGRRSGPGDLPKGMWSHTSLISFSVSGLPHLKAVGGEDFVAGVEGGHAFGEGGGFGGFAGVEGFVKVGEHVGDF